MSGHASLQKPPASAGGVVTEADLVPVVAFEPDCAQFRVGRQNPLVADHLHAQRRAVAAPRRRGRASGETVAADLPLQFQILCQRGVSPAPRLFCVGEVVPEVEQVPDIGRPLLLPVGGRPGKLGIGSATGGRHGQEVVGEAFEPRPGGGGETHAPGSQRAGEPWPGRVPTGRRLHSLAGFSRPAGAATVSSDG